MRRLRPATAADEARAAEAEAKARRAKVDEFAKNAGALLLVAILAQAVALETLGIAALATWIRRHR